MPLARMAMYERGVDVLLAPTWDNSDEWVPTLRHIAKEGQIFVVGVTAFLRGVMCRGISRMPMSCMAARTTSCRVATPRSSLLAAS